MRISDKGFDLTNKIMLRCEMGSPLMYHVRNAVHEDFAKVAAMPQNADELYYMFPRGKFPASPQELEEVALARKSPTVITVDGEIAAYCTLYDVVEGKRAWLGNVIVHPDYRRSGVGTFMLAAMKHIAHTEHRAASLHLVCHNTNTGAMLFYYKHGFKPYDIKTMTDYRGHTIVGIMMSLRLEAAE